MAITQQIVRITRGRLKEASVDVATLERLLQFDLVEPGDALDLDWAPRGLLALAGRSLTEMRSVALRELLEGSRLLNEAYPVGPQEDPAYSDVTCLLAPEVQRATRILAGVAAADILRSFPAALEAQREVLGELASSGLAEYYRNHFAALLSFAQETADQGLSLVQWWD